MIPLLVPSESSPVNQNFSAIFDKFCFLYTNADSFLNKVDLKMVIAGNEPDLILITEILPKSLCKSLSTARLSLYGYGMRLFSTLIQALINPPNICMGWGFMCQAAYMHQRFNFLCIHPVNIFG